MSEYREGWIRASIGKGRIQASTGKVESGRVSRRKNSSEYWKGGIRASTGKVGIRGSTKRLESERVLKK